MVSRSPQRALVGRDDELEQLRTLVTDLAAGRGRSVWVEGEPGIGKSTLLTAGLADARRLGCAVFWESADEARQRFPLWVLLDCLRVGSRSVDPARAEIAALLRGEGPAGPTPADIATAVAERLLVLVDRLCAASPVVVVVEDLQWADEASLAVWVRLHRVVAQLPLLLVAACRQVPARPEVTALREQLTGPDTVTMTLRPLATDQAVDVVERLVGGTPGPRLRRQLAQAGGNPLYLRELSDALLREHGLRFTAGVAELAGPADRRPVTLAAAIARRLGFLSERTTGVLRLAALLGPEFAMADLRVVTGSPTTTVSTLAAVVREAVAAGVLVESETGGGLAFRHGLIRQALYEGMPAQVRSGLHRHAAQAFAEAGVAEERVAEHLVAAPQVVDSWVVDWVVKAAPALTYRAPQIATDLLERVREQTAPTDPRRESLDTSLVTTSFLLSRNDDAERLARSLLAGTREPAVAGQMAWTLAYVLLRTLRQEEALAVTTRALAGRRLTPMWAARLRALQALILVQRGPGSIGEAEATALRAEAEGERAGDGLAVGYALHALAMVRSRLELDAAALLEVVDRALTVIGAEPEATDLRLMLMGNRIAALDNLGRMAESDRAVGEALALAERSGTPQRLALIRLLATEHCWFCGRWDDAVAEIDAAGDVLPSGTQFSLVLRGIAALIAGHRDERAALDAHLAAVADLDITDAGLRPFALFLVASRALAAERDGRPDQALAIFTALLDPHAGSDEATRHEDNHLWQPEIVRLALTVGDRATAEAATARCEAEAQATPTRGNRASAGHCRALLAADPAGLLAAAEAYDRAGLPLCRGQALENAAVLLAQRDGPAAAHGAHAQAVGIYTELGAAWDVLRADSRLRPLGVRRGSRGPRRRPRTGWDALTPTELKLAELVAEGRSNPDIAAELFLSRRTVQTHVSHILAKLGANSRIDIAHEVSRRRPRAS
jgi:DNA-binding CsgD family transcriptional regulator